YFYSVKYKDSSWATMLENRLSLARDLLKDTGSIFVRCDYNGNWIVRPLMDEIFGKENFRNEIVITRTKTALYIATPQKLSKNLGQSYDNIYWYSKSFSITYPKISEGILHLKRESYWKDLKSFYDRPTNRYELLGILPEKGCSWVWKKDDALKAVKNYEEFLKISEKNNETLEDYWFRTGMKLKFARKEGNTIKYWVEPIQKISITDWTFLEGYARAWGFPTENSEALLKIIFDFTSNEGDLVMDFFLGSGTTTAVAHKLGRKWIGVEMGEHFYSVVLPRMKKVLAYDKSGISKEKDVKEKYNENKAGGFFKYYELEQYEQTLKKCRYKPSEPFLDLKDKSIYQQYVFMKDLKLLEAMELDYKNDKIKIDFSKIYPNIDLAETLSNLTGKCIKKITKDCVEFEDNTKIDFNNIDFKLIKPLIWW
ncbi:MAG: site-specific DNA-methyltransferase, partial [Candidatus Woesearchaeota archaeon]